MKQNQTKLYFVIQSYFSVSLRTTLACLFLRLIPLNVRNPIWTVYSLCLVRALLFQMSSLDQQHHPRVRKNAANPKLRTPGSFSALFFFFTPFIFSGSKWNLFCPRNASLTCQGLSPHLCSFSYGSFPRNKVFFSVSLFPLEPHAHSFQPIQFPFEKYFHFFLSYESSAKTAMGILW